MKRYSKICVLLIIGILLFQNLRSQEKLINPINSSIEFIENKGQIYDSNGKEIKDILFVSKNSEYPFYLRKNGISFILTSTQAELSETSYRMDLDFEGINKNLKVLPKKKLKHYYNYYKNFNKNGIRNVAAYQEIALENIYKGIDFVIYENSSKQLEYDFIVKANSDPKAIRFSLKTDDKIELSSDGKLLIKNELGTIEKFVPYSYQFVNGQKTKVNSHYKIEGNNISFELGEYDKSAPLIIDPVMRAWGTYLGGSLNDLANDLGVDGNNNIYVTGKTRSISFISTPGAYQTTLAGNWDYDCFIAKYNENGTLEWATYFGGNSFDEAKRIAVKPNGDFYITGITHGNFENVFATQGTHQQFNNGGILPTNPGYDAFLTKFNTNGERVWSTYYGGTGYDYGNSIAIAEDGIIYFAGLTQSTQNIASTGAFKTSYSGGNDVFLAKMDDQGQRIWGTYFGSSGNDSLGGIAYYENNIYLAGGTTSSSGITSYGCWLYNHQGGMDVFISKFNENGQQLWSTYYGSSEYDLATDISVSSAGDIIIAGTTASNRNITTTNSSQSSIGGGRDGFIARFSQGGNRVWASYLGGSQNDGVKRIAVDNNNGFAVTGETFSNSAFASANSHQVANGGGSDAFITHYRADGVKDWSSFFGGENDDLGLGIAFDSQQNYIIAGSTFSTNDIASEEAQQEINRGAGDAFIAKFFQSYSNTISSNPFSGSYCAGASFNISFTVNEPFFTGNVFTAQLSDANGSFASPVNIGTLNSVNSGSISVIIPQNTGSGTAYRIRVVGSNPYTVGSNNGSNLSIQQKPVPIILGDTAVRCLKYYIYHSENKNPNYSYRWSLIGGRIEGSDTLDSVKVAWDCVTNGTIKLVVTNLNACSDSTTLAVGITNLSAPDIYGNSLVFTHSTNQYRTDSTENFNFLWSAIGGVIRGANNLKTVSIEWGDIGAGILNLKRTNDLGLSDSATFNVKISDFDFQFPTSPNEKLLLCNENEIKWAADNLDSLIFSYSYNNGLSFVIVDTISASDGSFLWFAPSVSNIDYIILKMADSKKPEQFYKIQNVGFISPIISLYKPTNFEYIRANSTYTIKWSAKNCDSIDIWYRSNYANPWEYVATVSAQDSVYDWSVPALTSNGYQIKLSVADDCYQVVSNTFRISSKFVEMLFPANGEQLGLCRFPYTLKFATNSVSAVNLFIKKESEVNWTEIAHSIAAGTGTFEWEWNTPPDLGFYLMKIEDANDTDFFSITEKSFEVTDACVNLLSPNGGEIWEIGSSQNIVWQSTAVSLLKLEYSADNEHWILIADSVPAEPNNYTWEIPAKPSETVKVRISVTGKPYINDRSAATLKIHGIRLNQPNGNESFLIGSQVNINWDCAGIDRIKIQFSSDNGLNWTVLSATYPASSKSFAWTVPNSPSNQCLIKVTDIVKSNLTDKSDTTFKISGLVLSSPIGGERLLAATTQQIKWNSNQVSNVKIQYSTDAGLSWITIISSTPAVPGVYDWNVPKTISYQCKVKISDISDSNNYDISPNVFRITGNGIILNYPKGKEIFLIGEEVEIKWNSINILNVLLEYSIDAGNTWHTITSNLPAEEFSYIWTVPNSPSTEGIIRISDMDNSTITDENSTFFRIKGDVYPPPSNWNFTSETGYNAIIITNESSYIDIAGREILPGDAIGAFFPSGTSMICAGYSIWDGSNFSLTAWGNNPRTAVKDGFNVNEKYNIRIWDGQEGKEHPADPVFSSPPEGSTGPADEYHHDNISIINDVRSSAFLRAAMKGGAYRMYSSNLKPVSMSIVDLLSAVASNLDIVKDDEANVYLPNPYTNTIGEWDVKKGYQINMLADDSLIIRGYRVIPSEHQRELQALKWYIVSYLPYGKMYIEDALQSINYNLIAVKNSDGQVYYPQFNINKIETMNPGEGYKLIVREDATLLYPSGPLIFAPNQIEEKGEAPLMLITSEKYSPLYELTDNNAILIVESSDLQNGDEIAVLNMENQIVGAAVFEDARAAITIWGDDKSTRSVIEGAKESEILKLKVWRAEDNKEYMLKIESVVDLIASKTISNLVFYQDALLLAQVSIDGLSSISDLASAETKLYNQPNPFKEQTDIIFFMDKETFATIEIYNEMGIKMATVFEGIAKSGANKITFSGQDLANGVYYCKLKSASNQFVHKLLIIK
ncbi:MAG: T9SS type A sorting domain-containing protein [Ignavibacteria bacterium]|jgi:hypothetical protein|nr:T9SS type A sorting domain-containing protein [Ignavibacteria bacterium]